MLTLDYQSRLPIYEQLYQGVVRLVALGVMQPNEQLPTVRALAQDLGVNPNTVSKAYQMLERDGITYSVTGRGSFISPSMSALDQKRAMAQDKLTTALNEAVANGLSKQEIFAVFQKFFEERGEES